MGVRDIFSSEFSDLLEELTYVPKAEEVYDITAGPTKSKTKSAFVGRMVRKNLLDPIYQAGHVTGKARRGEEVTPQEGVDIAANLAFLPGGTGGLGMGARLPAGPWRSRTLDMLKARKAGKQDLGEAPKLGALLNKLKKGNAPADELKHSGMERLGVDLNDRYLIHDMVGGAEANLPNVAKARRSMSLDLPLPLKKEILGGSKISADQWADITSILNRTADKRLKDVTDKRKVTNSLRRLGKEGKGGWSPELAEKVIIEEFGSDPAELSSRASRALNTSQRFQERQPPRTYYKTYVNDAGEKYREVLYKWGDKDRPQYFDRDHFQGKETNLRMHSIEDEIVLPTGEKATRIIEMQPSKWIREQKAHPSAPFEKDWYKVIMKDAVNRAVEAGSDALVWSTGENRMAKWKGYIPQSAANVYDKSAVKFIEREYGVKAERIGSVGSKPTNYNVGHRSTSTDRGNVHTVFIDYGDLPGEAIGGGRTLLRGRDVMGVEFQHALENTELSVRTANAVSRVETTEQIIKFPTARHAEEFAEFYKDYINNTYKREDYSKSLWKIPITDKMRQTVKEGQYLSVAKPDRKILQALETV